MYVFGIDEAVEAVDGVDAVSLTIGDSPVAGRAGAGRPSVTGRITIVGNGLTLRRLGAEVGAMVGTDVAVVGGAIVVGATVVGGTVVATVVGAAVGGGMIGGEGVAGGGTIVGGVVAGGTIVGGRVAGARVVGGTVAVRLMGTTYPFGAASLPGSGVTPERIGADVAGLVGAVGDVGGGDVGAVGDVGGGVVGAVGDVGGGVAGAVAAGTIGPLWEATRPSGGTIIGPGPAGSDMLGAMVELSPLVGAATGAGAGTVVGSTTPDGGGTVNGGRGRARLEGPAVRVFFAFARGASARIAIPNDGPATTFVTIATRRTLAGPRTTRTRDDSCAMVRCPSAATAVTPPTNVITAVPNATMLSRRRSDGVSCVGIRS